METQQEYTTDLTQLSGDQVAYRKNFTHTLIGLILLASGAAMILGATQLEDKNSSVYLSLMVFGPASLLFGGFMLLFGKKEYIYLPTMSKIGRDSFFFEPHQARTVCEAVEKKDFSPFKTMKSVDNSTIRVDVLRSEDNRFFAAQAYRYVPYTYTPASPMVCAYEEKAKECADCFKK